MSGLYEYEIGKSADILCRELFKLKSGETFAITSDTESDVRVVEGVARAAFAVGAKPIVIRVASPLGVGRAGDSMLPVNALGAALKESDAWVEFNNQWLLYSTPYEFAMKGNKNLRYLCLVGMNADMMTRCLGRIDYPTLRAYQEKFLDVSKKGKHMKFTTESGTNVEFDTDLSIPFRCHVGYADTPGSHMLSGQISWTPKFETINGTITFDGSIVPPVGLLEAPVKLHIEKGRISKIEGGKDALEYENWLRGFNDPNMFRLAHASYGCNPGAKLTGNILEDERVWGCTEWGIGYVGPSVVPPDGIPAASHTDGICLNSSIWLDGEQITDRGKVVHRDLIELAKKLGKA
jgi:2,5-dihydroxypyridine 5,6-dioxygenase